MLLHGGDQANDLLIDALFGEPNDWSRHRRMLAIGVHAGMVDEVVTDKYESRLPLDHYLLVRPNATW